jgi:hypothetical protein
MPARPSGGSKFYKEKSLLYMTWNFLLSSGEKLEQFLFKLTLTACKTPHPTILRLLRVYFLPTESVDQAFA